MMSSMAPDQMSWSPISGLKRPAEAISGARKPRSKIPCRRGVPPFPATGVGGGSSDVAFGVEEAVEPAESSSSCFPSEISSESSLILAGSEAWKRMRAPQQLRQPEIPSSGREVPENEFRRVTRSYARQRERLRWVEREEDGGQGLGFPSGFGGNAKGSKGGAKECDAMPEASVSEVSQVSGVFPSGRLKKKAAESVAIEKDRPEISESSCLESVSDSKTGRIPSGSKSEGARSQISQNFAVPIQESPDRDLDSDLACSEELSDDGGRSAFSSCEEMTLSEFEAVLFHRGSEMESSDYSLSVVSVSSSSDFSEKSRDGSAPSPMFSLFLQLARQVSRSSELAEAKASFGSQDDSSQEFTVMMFEDGEDEESYEKFRRRERKDAFLHDYGNEYSSMRECGYLILDQRLLMVNWIVEHATAMELQLETLFLGVSLLDRFLSRGYFNTERNLQLLGIACVTLATRLEENQPFNSIRQRSFKVGSNEYSRSEVVAMEWLVQEVLKFKCFLPTTHHFLWFYLKAARADSKVENLSRYLAVLSLLDHKRLGFLPSTVAAGLVILACLATNHDDSCHMVMETHVRTKDDDLPKCIQSLQWLVKHTCCCADVPALMDSFQLILRWCPKYRSDNESQV